MQFQGPCRRYGNLVPQPKLHVETLIDLPLARESSSNGNVWVRKWEKQHGFDNSQQHTLGVGRCFIRHESYHNTRAEGTAAIPHQLCRIDLVKATARFMQRCKPDTVGVGKAIRRAVTDTRAVVRGFYLMHPQRDGSCGKERYIKSSDERTVPPFHNEVSVS